MIPACLCDGISFFVGQSLSALCVTSVIIRFESIVKPKDFYERHAADGTSGRRCYFYNVDLQGRLFLEETLPKNVATSIKAPKFLDFFFRRLRSVTEADKEWMKEHDIPTEDYPFVSPCGKELNFVRPAATPIVFHSLVHNHDSGDRQLVFGGGDKLVQPFDERRVCTSIKTGRLYHELDENMLRRSRDKADGTPGSHQQYGLIRSSVAVTLSERIVPLDDENDDGSGLAFHSPNTIIPIPWLPLEAEPGPWSMPNLDE
jgi:hypothetical protein